MKKLILIIFLLLLIPIITNATPPSAPPAPFDYNLYFSETPAINKPVDIFFEVTAKRDIINLTVEIFTKKRDTGYVYDSFQNEFEMLNGNLNWKGSLKQGESITLTAKLIAKEEGYYNIFASGFVSERGGGAGYAKYLHYKILEGETKILETFPPKNNWQTACGRAVSNYADSVNANYTLEFSETPLLGRSTNLILKVNPNEDISNLGVSLAIPYKAFNINSVKVSKPQKSFSGKEEDISILNSNLATFK